MQVCRRCCLLCAAIVDEVAAVAGQAVAVAGEAEAVAGEAVAAAAASTGGQKQKQQPSPSASSSSDHACSSSSSGGSSSSSSRPPPPPAPRVLLQPAQPETEKLRSGGGGAGSQDPGSSGSECQHGPQPQGSRIQDPGSRYGIQDPGSSSRIWTPGSRIQMLRQGYPSPPVAEGPGPGHESSSVTHHGGCDMTHQCPIKAVTINQSINHPRLHAMAHVSAAVECCLARYLHGLGLMREGGGGLLLAGVEVRLVVLAGGGHSQRSLRSR